MNVTGIEWTATIHTDGATTPGFSANPLKYHDKRTGEVVWGCVKKSPGCAHCYAEQLAKRYGRGGSFTKAEMEHLDPFLDEAELRKMLTAKTVGGVAVSRSRCFVGDMTDCFGEWVPDALLDRLFAVFAWRADVTWQVLTKRADRMAAYLNRPYMPGAVCDAAQKSGWSIVGVDRKEHSEGHYSALTGPTWPLPNVWLGVSVENQAAADERVPHLLRTPAAVRFLSCEPLLGPVDLSPWLGAEARCPNHPCVNHKTSEPQNVMRWATCMACNGAGSVQGVEWVIVGGEGGPGARPMAPAWARTLRDQCNAAGVAFFHKQNGEWWGWSQMSDADKAAVYNPLPPELEYHPDHRNHNPHVKPHQMVFSGGTIGVGESVYRVGKKAAGRLLDGRTWDEFPAAPATVGKE